MKAIVRNLLKSRYKDKYSGVISRNILRSLLHGLFLLLMGYVWLGMNYTFGDEAFLIKWTTLIKREFLAMGPRPSSGDVLFINTSSSKVPVNTYADPLSLKPAVELITDRDELARLLELMSPLKDSIKLIVIDILFDIPANGDSLLEKRLSEFGDKILGVSHISEDGTIVPPGFSVPYALSTYRSAAGMYFKYPVAYKGMKTVPTAMYEKTTDSEIIRKGLFFREGKKYSFKAPVTDLKVTMKDFRMSEDLTESNFAVHHLETINLMGRIMDPNDLKQLFSGRVVMIGDFSTDIHKTVAGLMPGVLILYNAYLTLLNGENLMTAGWLILMLAGFTLISYRMLTGKEFGFLDNFRKKYRSRWFHFFLDSIDELFYLSVLTLLSYFFFNIHINILVLFIYLKLAEFAIDLFKNRKKIKT